MTTKKTTKKKKQSVEAGAVLTLNEQYLTVY